MYVNLGITLPETSFLLEIPSCHVRAVSFREGKKKKTPKHFGNDKRQPPCQCRVSWGVTIEKKGRLLQVEWCDYRVNGWNRGLYGEYTIVQKGFMCISGGFWHQHFWSIIGPTSPPISHQYLMTGQPLFPASRIFRPTREVKNHWVSRNKSKVPPKKPFWPELCSYSAIHPFASVELDSGFRCYHNLTRGLAFKNNLSTPWPFITELTTQYLHCHRCRCISSATTSQKFVAWSHLCPN